MTARNRFYSSTRLRSADRRIGKARCQCRAGYVAGEKQAQRNQRSRNYPRCDRCNLIAAATIGLAHAGVASNNVLRLVGDTIRRSR